MNQITAFALTLAIELPITVGAAASRHYGQAVSLKRALVFGVVASGLTHPIAWWVSANLAPNEVTIGFLVIEALVTIVETVVLKLGLRWPWLPAAVLSAVCNASSATVGVLIFLSGYA